MHGINEAFGVSDRTVAGILGCGKWPHDDIQAWDDESKDLFMAEFMDEMTESSMAEVITESGYGTWPATIRKMYTDPLEFTREFKETIYLYMEPHLSDQLERARKLLEGMAA